MIGAEYPVLDGHKDGRKVLLKTDSVKHPYGSTAKQLQGNEGPVLTQLITEVRQVTQPFYISNYSPGN